MGSTAEPDEKLEPGILCQIEQRLLYLAHQHQVSKSLLTYLHFHLWNGFPYFWAWLLHPQQPQTSSALKATTSRSKMDHWRLTKTSEAQFQTLQVGMWVSQLWADANSGRINSGKSRQVAYNKQSSRSHYLWAEKERNSKKEGHKLGRNPTGKHHIFLGETCFRQKRYKKRSPGRGKKWRNANKCSPVWIPTHGFMVLLSQQEKIRECTIK